MRSNPKNDQKKLLIAELKKAGIKHTPENIIRITQDPSGKIVFLETGKAGDIFISNKNETSGLSHLSIPNLNAQQLITSEQDARTMSQNYLKRL